jgi:hypothetical protein
VLARATSNLSDYKRDRQGTRQKNTVVGLAGPGMKNDCDGEGRQPKTARTLCGLAIQVWCQVIPMAVEPSITDIEYGLESTRLLSV